ncbi:LOW QUALITY PROTEIN: protein tyrosine phosphatase receptor type C-associated protein [Ciconia maguari]
MGDGGGKLLWGRSAAGRGAVGPLWGCAAVWSRRPGPVQTQRGGRQDPAPLPQHPQVLRHPPTAASRHGALPCTGRPPARRPPPVHGGGVRPPPHPRGPLPFAPALPCLSGTGQPPPGLGRAGAGCQPHGGDPGCPHPQAGARRCPPVPVLLVLAKLVAAAEPVGSRNDRTVGALLGLLLCLAVGLAVAWHRLCRLSAGRYHPRPMGRRALALLRDCWHWLRGQGDPAVRPCHGDGEVATAAPWDREEELMPWSQDRRPDEEEEEEEKEEEEEEEEKPKEGAGEQEEEEAEAEAAPEGRGEPPGRRGGGGGSSAEALLSDLHAFSGTAAWGDARPHVTAL